MGTCRTFITLTMWLSKRITACIRLKMQKVCKVHHTDNVAGFKCKRLTIFPWSSKMWFLLKVCKPKVIVKRIQTKSRMAQINLESKASNPLRRVTRQSDPKNDSQTKSKDRFMESSLVGQISIRSKSSRSQTALALRRMNLWWLQLSTCVAWKKVSLVSRTDVKSQRVLHL